MSKLYFTSEQGEAAVHGSEFELLRSLGAEHGQAAWWRGGDDYVRAAHITTMIPAEKEPRLHRAFARAVQEAGANESRVGETSTQEQNWLIRDIRMALSLGVALRVGGVDLYSTNVTLNSTLAVRSPVLAVAAKLGYQGELHAWVEGPDRNWLAALLESAVNSGVFRRTMNYTDLDGHSRTVNQGWDDCLALLRAAGDGPVVLNYSVTCGWPCVCVLPEFPRDANGFLLPWNFLTQTQLEAVDELSSGFDELPREQQWARAMAGLRSEKPWAQLSESTLFTPFHYGLTVEDLLAADAEERVRAAAGSDLERTDA